MCGAQTVGNIACAVHRPPVILQHLQCYRRSVCPVPSQIKEIQVHRAPVTPRRVSTALAQSCLNFPSTVRSQEKSDILRYHGVLTASLQQPWRCYRACMAFYNVPTEFSLVIYCALTTLSRRFHDVSTELS